MSSEGRQPVLSWLVGTGIALQVGLLWVQGAQLYRQNQVLQDIQEELQDISDLLDQQSTQGDADQSYGPAAHRMPRHAPRLQRVRQETQPPADDQDQATKDATKDLEATRDSARKAVSDAREARSKLSIQENARKAEEQAKIESAQNSWTRWAWAALGLVAAALLGRAFLRSRA